MNHYTLRLHGIACGALLEKISGAFPTIDTAVKGARSILERRLAEVASVIDSRTGGEAWRGTPDHLDGIFLSRHSLSS